MFKDTAKGPGKSYLEKYFPQKSLNAFRYGIELHEKSRGKKKDHKCHEESEIVHLYLHKS